MTGILALVAILGCLATKWFFSVHIARLRKALENLHRECRDTMKELAAQGRNCSGLSEAARKTSLKIQSVRKNTTVLGKMLEELRAIEERELETQKNQKELLKFKKSS